MKLPGFTAQLSLAKSAEQYEVKGLQAGRNLVTPQRGLGGPLESVLQGWLARSGGLPRIFCKDDICAICDEFGCHLMTSSRF